MLKGAEVVSDGDVLESFINSVRPPTTTKSTYNVGSAKGVEGTEGAGGGAGEGAGGGAGGGADDGGGDGRGGGEEGGFVYRYLSLSNLGVLCESKGRGKAQNSAAPDTLFVHGGELGSGYGSGSGSRVRSQGSPDAFMS